MKLTGHVFFGLHQAKDLVIETVSALPSFLPQDKGRLLFVETVGPAFGVYFGGVSSWIKLDSVVTGNSSKSTFKYQGGLGQGQTRTLWFDDILGYDLMLGNGSIIGATFSSSLDRTAGMATMKPTFSGTPITETDLHLTLDGATVNDQYGVIAPGTTGYVFSSGEKVGVQVETDGSWSTGGSEDVSVGLLLFFD